MQKEIEEVKKIISEGSDQLHEINKFMKEVDLLDLDFSPNPQPGPGLKNAETGGNVE